MGYGWRRYVPVAKRRQQAANRINKFLKKGQEASPVCIEGRKIAKSFWGQAWCEHIECFSDYENRLPRGRTYARNGSVCHLSTDKGKIESLVSGSELYKIKGEIKPLPPRSWQKIKSLCAGEIGSVLELLQGKLSSNIMGVVTDPKHGLFPSPKEINLSCNCPDWAQLCKHLAAVLYGIGARLDESPEILFSLRGVDYNELITGDIQLPSKGKGRRLTANISDVFDIELAQTAPKKQEKIDNKKLKKVKPKRAKKVPLSKTPNKKTANKRSATPNNNNTKEFKPTGAAVRRLRKNLEMNKAQFAMVVGVSPSTITNWESKQGKLMLKEASIKSLLTTSKFSLKQAWRRLPN